MTPERKHRLETVIRKRQFDITVVLENVFDPHNISAVMRTCDAVGIQEIHVLTTSIPPHKKWGARSSSSAAKWLTIHQHTDTEACFRVLRQKFPLILTTFLEDTATPLYDLNLTTPVALIFGNEHSGVSEEVRTLADGNFVIPQVGMIRSLNISVACAITLYEAYRQKSLAGHYNQPAADPIFLKSLENEWNLKSGE